MSAGRACLLFLSELTSVDASPSLSAQEARPSFKGLPGIADPRGPDGFLASRAKSSLALAALVLLSVLPARAMAQERPDSGFGFAVGLAFGITSVEDFALSDGGPGLLGRVRWGKFDVEFAAHHLNGNPSRTNTDSEGSFRTEILLGSRHLLASYRLRLGNVLLRPGLGVAWYSIEFGQDRDSIERFTQKDAAIALSVGLPVGRWSGWEVAVELAGRAKLPIGQDSTEPRDVLAGQIVVSLPGS